MDKIIVPFEDIRCLGNIIIPKSLSEYTKGDKVVLIEDTASINGITNNILKMDYYITPSIVIDAPTSFISYADGKEISFPISVVDEDNNRIHDIRVDWDVDNDFSGHIVTGANGTANFEYSLATDPTTGAKNYSFTVDFEILASDHNPKITNSVTITTGCTLTLARTGYMED